MRVAIIYYNFLDSTGTEQKIGGVETYLWNLANLIVERGDEPVLFQPATMAFEKKIGPIRVIGVERNRRRLRRNTRKDLFEHAMSIIDKTEDFIIFGADHASVHTNYPHTLSIQHGISWDVPGRLLRENILGRIPLIPDWVCKKYEAYRSYLYFNNCANRVCVDYNFLNWYRTQIADSPQGNVWVIPNFVDIPADYQPNMDRYRDGPVKVIFARRFVEIRGINIMIQAATNLLKTFVGVEFCFAGEGPGLALIVEAFEQESRVSILKYMPEESLQIHETFHIAVVPSIGSEGTSLSLAEAMGAGCAVVATDVGGMTNMVLDGYNGRLVAPNAEDLENVLAELIRDQALCLELGERAAQTARKAFSLDRWKTRWSEVLDAVKKNN
jgi:glycosyltransferase involved in cell wall biosynthesis